MVQFGQQEKRADSSSDASQHIVSACSGQWSVNCAA